MLPQDAKIAILAANGVSQRDISGPREVLEKAGMSLLIVSPQEVEVKACDSSESGVRFKVDIHVNAAEANEFHGLIIPGGDHIEELFQDPYAVSFVRQFFNSGKVVGALNQGPKIIVLADVAHGRKLTGSQDVKNALQSAGAIWVDEEVVVDNGLITVSNADVHMDFFCHRFLEELRQGIHQRTETVI